MTSHQDPTIPARVTYEIDLCMISRWATGTQRGTFHRTIRVEEEATILGGARAIDAAIAQVGEANVALELAVPGISPNPVFMDWPLGS